MAIDVGFAAIDRISNADGRTAVNQDNPSNATGLIFQIEIYCYVGITDVKVASFGASGDDMTTNEYVSVANCSAGLNTFTAPTDFSPFGIKQGDYLGIYFNLGRIDADSNGTGIWEKFGDNIPCSSVSFTNTANVGLSLYATGYELGQINIGDSWKDIQNIKINVGDDWKQLVDGKVNIGDAWKDILH